MSTRPHPVRMPLALAALGCALVLTACSAGKVTQTDSQVAAVSGANGDAGPIAVRDATLAWPEDAEPAGPAPYEEGDDAPLLLTIVNGGGVADKLVSVTSPAAAEVTVDGPATIAAGTSVTSSSEAANPAGDAIALPRPGGVGEQGDELSIMLTDLARALRPGLPTEVTLLFRDSGQITLQVPVAAPDAPRESADQG